MQTTKIHVRYLSPTEAKYSGLNNATLLQIQGHLEPLNVTLFGSSVFAGGKDWDEIILG